jgi:two-component system phosphate regulon sensor histidine kinase PhoR
MMKKALLKRIIFVLAIVLIVSTVVSLKSIWDVRVDGGIETLTNSLAMLDESLDYNGDIEEQIDAIYEILPEPKSRITVLLIDGTVLGDTNTADIAQMENHLNREEVQIALKKPIGHSLRYSDTINEELLYAARISSNGSYILRMALPFEGLVEELVNVFLILILVTLVVMLLAVFAVNQYMKQISNPLADISLRMQSVNKDNLEVDFPEYRFEEMNIIADTTKRLTNDIQGYIRKVKIEKRIRQEFFSNASHELKTPITSVKGYAELLDKGFVKDKKTERDFIRRILSETENMNELINDILMISRLESEEVKVTYSMIRMNTLIEEIFDTLEPLAESKNITLHKECMPIVLEANMKQIRELLLNIIENAVKYNREEGNVWVTVTADNSNVITIIKDDGMGISKKDQKRIFERFYRIEEGRHKQVGGTGLGLSIVKHVVEYYKGSIVLDSGPGEGCTFTITIPKVREERV